MSNAKAAIEYASDHQAEFLGQLKELVRIPSISTLPDHNGDMRQAAEWLTAKMADLGFEKVQIMPTDGHSVVYGEMLHAGKDAPTILFYGHYDVQPADPLDLWNYDPFGATERNGDLIGRGASDMKGQVVAHLNAVEAMVRTSGVPVNLKYMLEGEEEIGSPNLASYIEAQRELLAADFCLNADGGILAAEIPSISYALRGLAYFEIFVQGPAQDLHSGQYGGPVDNPARVLASLLAGMHDSDGKITLPGYYDSVRNLTEQERTEFAELPQDDDWWVNVTGVPQLAGEKGYTGTELATARPTLDINGMISGFTGEGAKTVLPAEASAKISMRLVPEQTPEVVEASLKAYLEANAPPTVNLELKTLAGSIPGISERDSNAVRAAEQAMKEVWGVKPLFKREGGTVPVVGIIKEMLDMDTLMLGFGLPDDNLHAPNEKFHLANFYRGIETNIRFAHLIAA